MRSSSVRPVHVLNPGGNDPEQHFAPGAKQRIEDHAPVNFHAYAACTGGSFFRQTARALAANGPVLLLLRGDFRESERALLALKNAGAPVAVSLKETGLHQISEQLTDVARLRRFRSIVTQADGCIAPTPEAADVYRAILRAEHTVAFIPTPYPLDDARWDFSRPVEQRRGIFIGTREWDIPTRNHAAALLMARQISDATGARVTVYNCDGRKEDRLIAEIGFPPDRLRVLPRGKTYADYLRIVAEHQLVLELDTSFVPGQVAGDALLCRLPCVGGNGAIGRLAFPHICGAGRTGAELIELVMRLLSDRDFYSRTVAQSQQHARERLSFARASEEISRFFNGVTPAPPRS